MGEFEENGNIRKDSSKDREAVLDRLEQVASVDNLTADQRVQYEESLKNYNDYCDMLDFVEQKGRKEGMEEGMQKGREKGRKESLCQIVLNMKKYGAPIDFIIKCIDLLPEER